MWSQNKGFLLPNLVNLRQFYMPFQRLEKSYALHSELNEQLFASKYLRVLPSEAELARELERRHVLDVGEHEGQ